MGFTTIFTIDLEISILNKRAKFLKKKQKEKKEKKMPIITKQKKAWMALRGSIGLYTNYPLV